jgi:arginyl-tRNA--protein-N-Asp/Glu arginylyltransferase
VRERALHAHRTEALRGVLERGQLEPTEPFPCPYLPDRLARQILIRPPALPPELYHAFLDLNYRRLGDLVYRPACQGCGECRSLRVSVEAFRPSRAQRRCRARNAGVSVEVGAPEPTDEKHALYRLYLEARHDGQMSGSREEFESFLYAAPGFTREVVFRVEGRLLGVGLADVLPQALSAVYFYFDPREAARSPGVLNVLALVDECRRRQAEFLYLGYYVAGSAAMAYKAGYRPYEILEADGQWRAGR